MRLQCRNSQVGCERLSAYCLAASVVPHWHKYAPPARYQSRSAMLQNEAPLKSEVTFDDDVIVWVRGARGKRSQRSTRNRHSLFVLPPKLGSSLRSLSPFRHRRSSLSEHVSASSSKCTFACPSIFHALRN